MWHMRQEDMENSKTLIYKKKRGDIVSSLLKALHWLPCKTRMYSMCSYVFKCLHGIAIAPYHRNKLLGYLSEEEGVCDGQ